MISRIRLTYFCDCSSEIDRGRVARIQKLPSSSLGMNSPPSRLKRKQQATRGTAPTSSEVLGRRSAKPKMGW